MQEWAGVDKETGAPLWYKDVKDDKGNPTGERTTTSTYSTADKYKLGSALPNVFGGLNNTFTFKGLDLHSSLLIVLEERYMMRTKSIC